VIPHRSTSLVASLLLAVTPAYAEERPRPYEVEPTLWNCPRGWLITHLETCVLGEHLKSGQW
jgi:hypothetical protein